MSKKNLFANRSFESESSLVTDNLGETPSSALGQQMQVLCFLDDKVLCEELSAQMSHHETYKVTQPANISDCLSKLRHQSYDVIISDIDVDSLKNDHLIKDFKRLANRTPIILVTDEKCDHSEVKYLDMGVDNVMPKPISIPLFFARMRTLLRWRSNGPSSTFQIGPFIFKPDTKILVQPDAVKIKLTEKETKILQFLLRRRGNVVSRGELLEFVWGYSKNVNTHTVETHIYRLRKKLKSTKISKMILTENNGYRIPIEI